MATQPASEVGQISYEIVAGIVRSGDHILLVEQQGPRDPRPIWVIPGGMMEPGELLHEALASEVSEETGLTIEGGVRLAYMVQCDVASEARQVRVYIFEISGWGGEIRPDDPDGLILQACFVPVSAALDLVHRLPRLHMWQPLVSYLQGGVPVGTVWLYRRGADGRETLVARLA